MCLGFSRTLAYPKYFSFLVSVCLRIDPISQISISTELSASGLMKACFEAATSEAQAAAAPRCLLARALHIAADKFWFSVVFYLTPEGPFHQAMGQGLESWCWRWDPEGDVRSSSGVRARGSSCSNPTQIAHKNHVICFWMPKASSFCSSDLWFGTAGQGGLNETGTAAAEGLTPPGAWGCGGCSSRAQGSGLQQNLP